MYLIFSIIFIILQESNFVILRFLCVFIVIEFSPMCCTIERGEILHFLMFSI